jgi:DNA-binding Lrp family transcriptional regulator
VDDIDRQIVAQLRTNARASFQSIGNRVSLSAPAVKRRVDRLEVAAAYTVAGEASAILHVRARDTPHLEEALERIRDTPGIIRTQTQVVLSTLFERPVTG